MKLRLSFVFVLLGILTLIFFHGHVNAATGITVSPARVDMLLPNNSNASSAAVSVHNDSDTALTLSATLMQVDTNSGNLSPLNIDSDLAKFIKISPSTITIEPKTSKNFKLDLSDSTILSPGGHYAALVIKDVDDNAKSVSLRASVSVSLFLTKQNGAIFKLVGENLATNGWLFSRPGTVKLKLKNQGNIYTTPRASISVFSSIGKLRATGVINRQNLAIFPNKDLTFSSKLVWQNREWLPGRYKITATYRADNSDNTSVAISYFWYFPPYIFVIVFVIVAIFILTWPKIKKIRKAPNKRTKKPTILHDIISTTKNTPKA